MLGRRLFQDKTSQTRTVPSNDPKASVRSSAENANEVTGLTCPFNVWMTSTNSGRIVRIVLHQHSVPIQDPPDRVCSQLRTWGSSGRKHTKQTVSYYPLPEALVVDRRALRNTGRGRWRLCTSEIDVRSHSGPRLTWGRLW